MTIRFVQAWNGYYPGQIVTNPNGGNSEATLVALGYAVTDLNGPDNTPVPVTGVINEVTGGIALVAGDKPNFLLALNSAYSPDPVFNGVTNFKALTGWYNALADAQWNPVFLPVVGDSTVYGTYSTGTPAVPGAGTETDAQADQYSWAGQLRTLFARKFGVAEAGFIGPRDGRVTAVSATPYDCSFLSYGRYVSSAGPGTFTFPLPSCTAFDILYWEMNGTSITRTVAGASQTWTQTTSGNGTVNPDATGAVAVNYATQSDSILQYSVSGLAQATHSVVVTGASANPFIVIGARYHSGSGVAVGRFGRSSWTSLDALGRGANNNLATPAQQWRIVAPFAKLNRTTMPTPLIIVSFGHNDCSLQLTAGSLTTLAVYAADIQEMITNAAANGSAVLLVSEPDPNNTEVVGGSTYRSYWQAARNLALTNSNCAHISIGDIWGSFATAVSKGYAVSAAGVHPLRSGCGSIANIVYAVLTRGEPFLSTLA